MLDYAKPAAHGEIFRLTYVSTTTTPCSEENLEAIAQASKRNNSKVGVTGVLIACGDEFIQILEGDEAQVRALFEMIADDPRHANVSVIATTFERQRWFSDWSMGCFYFRPEDLPDGFVFESKNGSRRLRPDAFSRCNDVLETFYREYRAGGAGGGFARPIRA